MGDQGKEGQKWPLGIQRAGGSREGVQHQKLTKVTPKSTDATLPCQGSRALTVPIRIGLDCSVHLSDVFGSHPPAVPQAGVGQHLKFRTDSTNGHWCLALTQPYSFPARGLADSPLQSISHPGVSTSLQKASSGNHLAAPHRAADLHCYFQFRSWQMDAPCHTGQRC